MLAEFDEELALVSDEPTNFREVTVTLGLDPAGIPMSCENEACRSGFGRRNSTVKVLALEWSN